MTPGFVYFLRCCDFVKIGFSKKPRDRIRYLQTSTPFEVELIGSHPGTVEHEQQLHKIFAKFRCRNEWFVCSESILEIAQNGLPYMDIPIVERPSLRILTKELERKAIELGASRAAVAKWRTRGIPYKWQIKFIQALQNLEAAE